jgi:hypothetical protein
MSPLLKAIAAGAGTTTATLGALGLLAHVAGWVPDDLDFHVRSLGIWRDHAGPVTVAAYSLVAVAGFGAADRLTQDAGGTRRALTAWLLAVVAGLAFAVAPEWIRSFTTVGPREADRALERLLRDAQGLNQALSALSISLSLAMCLAAARTAREAPRGGTWITLGALTLLGGIAGDILVSALDNTDCAWLHASHDVAHVGFRQYLVIAGAVSGAALALGLLVFDRVLGPKPRARPLRPWDLRVTLAVVALSIVALDRVAARNVTATRAAERQVQRNILVQ